MRGGGGIKCVSTPCMYVRRGLGSSASPRVRPALPRVISPALSTLHWATNPGETGTRTFLKTVPHSLVTDAVVSQIRAVCVLVTVNKQTSGFLPLG